MSDFHVKKVLNLFSSKLVGTFAFISAANNES